MNKQEVEKYLNKSVAVFVDKTKVDPNGSKYFSGTLTALTDNTLTLALQGCSYASEICLAFSVIAFITLSKQGASKDKL